MSAYNSDNETRSESDSSSDCTLVDKDTLRAAIQYMEKHESKVFTFDHDRQRLVPWIWPSNSANVAIEPNTLKTVLLRSGIPPPTCFCSQRIDGELITNTAQLSKKGTVWQFACRRVEGCGFLVKLDKFNPNIAKLEQEKKLADGGKNYAFMCARWDELNDDNFDDYMATSSFTDTSPNVASSGSQTSNVAGPSRPSKQLSRNDRRPAPYTVPQQLRRGASPVSPPRHLIERTRRPYNLIEPAGPAPPASSVAASPGIRAWEHIPPELLDLAYSVMADGVPVEAFERRFVHCKCGRIVYQASYDAVHGPLCEHARHAQ